MLIPVQESKKDFSDLNLMIYGPPKSGKTTLAKAVGDNAGKPSLFIMTEDGGGALSVPLVRVSSKQGIDRLLSVKLEPNKDQLAKEYSCIVLDLVSEIDQMISDWVCETNGVDTLGGVSNGIGWVQAQNEFKKIVKRFLDLGLPVVFISHARERSFKQGEHNITVQTPDASNKTSKSFILGKCDAIGFIYSGNHGQAKVSFLPSLSSDCGSRFDSIVKEYSYDVKAPVNTIKKISEDFKTCKSATTKTA